MLTIQIATTFFDLFWAIFINSALVFGIVWCHLLERKLTKKLTLEYYFYLIFGCLSNGFAFTIGFGLIGGVI